jgi:xanthine dehydrogenase small subunit
MRFILNDQLVETDPPAGMPVLDWVREVADLKGTKHACREGDCGACMVLLGELEDGRLRYRQLVSCLLPAGELDGRHLVTIEGLNGKALNAVQQAMVDHGASQCGFCTPGIVVSITGHLLDELCRFDREQARLALFGNLCRCTGYTSIRRAIDELLARLDAAVDTDQNRIEALVREHVLPRYFGSIADRLAELGPAPVVEARQAARPWVAGGTDQYVQRLEALEEDSPFLVMRALPSRIWTDDGHVYISGSSSAEELGRSPLIDRVMGRADRVMELFGSLPIRHRSTVAGNIVNASPIGDMTIMLLALGAELGLARDDDRRTLPLCEFFLEYKTLDLRAGELVEWIRFPDDRAAGLFNFEKVSKRIHLDIASVNTAIWLRLEDDRIGEIMLSAGGVAPVPFRLRQTEAALVGRRPSVETVLEASQKAMGEISPISDIRGSADYKRLLLRRLLLAHFHALGLIEEQAVAEAIA